MKVRRHIYFEGRVQGVGFRYQSCYLAKTFALTGWVANLDDGRVEMEVQGEQDVIEIYLKKLSMMRFVHIDKADITPIPLGRDGQFEMKN